MLTPNTSARRFACPFFQRTPERYGHVQSCRGPGWTSIHRVKEHIYRRHSQPVVCHRCLTTFQTENDLIVHLRTITCTDAYPKPVFDGIDRYQLERLKSRKHSNLTEEERWRVIYRECFPNDDENSMPSPYYVYEQDMVAQAVGYYTLCTTRLPEMVGERIATQFPYETTSNVRSQIIEIVRACAAELLSPESSTPLRSNHSDPSFDMSSPSLSRRDSNNGIEMDFPVQALSVHPTIDIGPSRHANVMDQTLRNVRTSIWTQQTPFETSQRVPSIRINNSFTSVNSEADPNLSFTSRSETLSDSMACHGNEIRTYELTTSAGQYSPPGFMNPFLTMTTASGPVHAAYVSSSPTRRSNPIRRARAVRTDKSKFFLCNSDDD